ncbi:MAG: cardiolipin synthase [Burkholderiales bacterium]
MNFSIAEILAALTPVVHIVGAIAVTIDAVLRKRQVPAVIGWVGLAWLAPIVGSMFYLAFGINRIKRSASALKLAAAWELSSVPAALRSEALRSEDFAARHPAFAGLSFLGQRLTGNTLLSGNAIEPLIDGNQAYPAMLEAIERAETSLTLVSYIFDNDRAGERFLEALINAQQRGVQVRVLIDDFGSRYTRPSMLKRLRKAGIREAAFLPTRVPRMFPYANLRNHRKIMVADGRTGFTGGMNIREGHWIDHDPRHPIHCLHFRVDGPAVADLQRTFAVDWAFTTGEYLEGETWFPNLDRAGSVAARGIPDGPDADIDNILHLLLGALSVATRRVRIVTPYFLPDEVLLRALHVAAMRGVEVDIVLPAKSNIPLLHWATAPQLTELISHGCRVHFTGPHFDHTKLMVVDSFWSLIGSTNWDARSLRLNFEYNLECYDEPLAQRLDRLIMQKIAAAHRVTPEELARPMPIRLRNGIARLFSPYL